ncbi:MAG: zinc-ribbon domain-containing protein, partial [Candidatus Heimdallarchaeota archaeon]|nr:zinc-ribbon domain-containing protein [Candidatus Heimdallarchaeota archaeon]
MANYCDKCGKPLNPDDIFCNNCGTQIKDSKKSETPREYPP